MNGVKVIKSYSLLTASLKSSADLSLDADRAVADFRAFLPVASVHASRVTNCLALDVMIEVVENLQKDLTAQKNRLQGT